MGTGVGLVRGGLGWHSGASPRSPREVAGVGGKHCLLPLPLHLLSPGILFVTLLRAIMCVGWGAAEVPGAALHGTPRHRRSILGVPGPAPAQHRGLQQTPPEVPPSSAMRC